MDNADNIASNKDGSAFRTIGELSKELNIKPHILRYWEDQFAMLQPLKRAGARRHYRPEDVEMVRTINRLVNEEGYTIKGARKFLTSNKSGNKSGQKSGGIKPENMLVQDASSGLSSPDILVEKGGVADGAFMLQELKAVRAKLSRALERA